MNAFEGTWMFTIGTCMHKPWRTRTRSEWSQGRIWRHMERHAHLEHACAHTFVNADVIRMDVPRTLTWSE
eukprot:1160721-Pelagomonas_calceolata.AAC.5